MVPFIGNLEGKPGYFYTFKGAPKLQFTNYSGAVIILFITGSCKSAFSTYSFGELDLCLSVVCMFYIFCILNFDAISGDFKTFVLSLVIYELGAL